MSAVSIPHVHRSHVTARSNKCTALTLGLHESHQLELCDYASHLWAMQSTSAAGGGGGIVRSPSEDCTAMTVDDKMASTAEPETPEILSSSPMKEVFVWSNSESVSSVVNISFQEYKRCHCYPQTNNNNYCCSKQIVFNPTD